MFNLYTKYTSQNILNDFALLKADPILAKNPKVEISLNIEVKHKPSLILLLFYLKKAKNTDALLYGTDKNVFKFRSSDMLNVFYTHISPYCETSFADKKPQFKLLGAPGLGFLFAKKFNMVPDNLYKFNADFSISSVEHKVRYTKSNLNVFVLSFFFTFLHHIFDADAKYF